MLHYSVEIKEAKSAAVKMSPLPSHSVVQQVIVPSYLQETCY